MTNKRVRREKAQDFQEDTAPREQDFWADDSRDTYDNRGRVSGDPTDPKLKYDVLQAHYHQLQIRFHRLAQELSRMKLAQLTNSPSSEPSSSKVSARLIRENAALTTQLHELLEAVAQVYRRETRAWKELANLRSALAALHTEGSQISRSPFAAFKSMQRYRDLVQRLQPLADTPSLPSASFHGSTKPISVPLTLEAQQVLLPPATRSLIVWCRPLGIAGDSSEIEVKISRKSEGKHEEVTHRLSSGKRTRVLRIESGAPEEIVEIRRTRGPFCALRLEISEAEERSATEGRRNRRVDTGARRPAADQPRRAKPAELEKKLWRGFSRYAIPELENLREGPARSRAERCEAAWHLVRWYFVHGDFSRALQNVRYMRRNETAPEKKVVLTETQCLLQLDHLEEAARTIEAASSSGLNSEFDFDLLRSTLSRKVAIKNGEHLQQVEAEQLSVLNQVFEAVGLTPLRKRTSAPLSISNLASDAPPATAIQDRKISVLMPAYNSSSTIDWAIASVLAQTWKNIEIIVVDDASTDATAFVVQQIAARDPRVRLIKKSQNEGAYAARNTGLEEASGDLITVHDADDWSHPQKLEVQLRALDAAPEAVAVLSDWVRVDEALNIVGPWIPKGTLYDVNLSSLLFKRDVLARIGPWHDVRVSADAEFRARLQSFFGESAVIRLPRNVLLSFALTREDSLTRSKATHLKSLFYGVRGTYRECYRYWHDSLNRSQDLPRPVYRRSARPFTPVGNKTAASGVLHYDVVVVMDFALRGGAFVSALNYILAARKLGKRVAVFHWRRYELTPTALNPRLYEACLNNDVDILSPGDEVITEYLLVAYPPILQHIIDPRPSISPKHVVVIVNQFASRLVSGADAQYDPPTVRANLREVYDSEGVWVPISSWVQRLIQEDERYPRPWPKPWYPLLDTTSWCTRTPHWRGGSRSVPVIGRHGRDAYTKWPARAEHLRQAYAADANCQVRFLGGADYAVKILGYLPRNWQVAPFDSSPVDQFLSDLDFFVHYPHEEYIEEFGRAVMEAMAVGIPVVLPPQFKETFGDAAVYAEPAKVLTVINDLWNSSSRYLERAAAGRAFVLNNCDHMTLAERLDAVSHTSSDRSQAALSENPPSM